MKKNRKKYGIIYTAENKITGEYYVGATADSVHQRKLDHQERAARGEDNYFHNAIATYGPEAFEWEQIDTASSLDELAQKEKRHVAKFKSKKRSLNSDSGGGFKKTVYQYNPRDGKFLKQYDCLRDAAKAVESHKNCIGNACIGQNKTCKGYYWSYIKMSNYIIKDNRSKQVVQYSLSGEKIAQYRSVSEASRKTGISKTCIARVCRGQRERSGGFKWKYDNSIKI